MRQLVHATFISTNRASFHLWCKKNLAKNLKVSKYYENDKKIVRKDLNDVKSSDAKIKSSRVCTVKTKQTFCNTMISNF